MSESRVVRLKVRFEDRSVAASCLQGLRLIPGASVNVVRGRVTADQADYDLELHGEDRVLERIARLLSKAQAALQEA